MRPGPPARRFRDLPQAEVLGLRVPVAATPLSRLLGLALLRRESAPRGLLLERCRSIHTFGMRFALDVHFLNAEGTCIRSELGVGPRRMLVERGASAVLELPAPTHPPVSSGSDPL